MLRQKKTLCLQSVFLPYRRVEMEKDEMKAALIEEKKELLYQIISDKKYKPLKLKEFAALLGVPKEEKEFLKEVFDQLIHDGKIILDEKNRYLLTGDEFKTGTFLSTTRGFGFVTVEGEEGGEDVYIAEADTKGAMNKDRVMLTINESVRLKRRRQGVILKILERATNQVVGTFQKNDNFGFVVPDNHKMGDDIYVALKDSKGAVTGHKVVVEIVTYGEGSKSPEGKITEIIGHMNDPGVDIASIVKAFNIPTEYSEAVMKEVEAMPDEVKEEDRIGRLDIRALQTVTIDGEDAKDLDDAITISKEAHGYKLGVHIADVSHYVKEGSALDKEALKRGTSVYLVDRVIPMLPHKLSNGICSLNAGCDRLALSCFMDIDEKGTIIGHKIAKTVIKVDERMSYTSVKKILEEKEEEERKRYEPLLPMFDLMMELALLLRVKRKQRGSIDFDFPESKILVDEKGFPTDVVAYDRNEATKIIEDFMLAANETIAEDYYWQEAPFVYRTHETPDPQKILNLSILIHNFGYTLHTGQEEIHPKELQKLLEKADGTQEAALIRRMTLRSMKQARYSRLCDGHFGLAAKYYCHFTSPIRRYPDLQIHRIISESLEKGLEEKRIKHYESILPEVASAASRTERRAEEAEREVDNLKKVEYMSQFIGDIFEGVISGVTAFGLYVELPNTVEGKISVTALNDDFYLFDEATYSLIGEHSRKVFKLGQRMKIMVTATDKMLRTIDFMPVSNENVLSRKEW